MTHSLELFFVKPHKLTAPEAKIYLKTYTRDVDKYIRDDDAHIFITPDCVSMNELDYQIERLKKELEVIRKKANKKFNESKNK